jgi:hypothetical protein
MRVNLRNPVLQVEARRGGSQQRPAFTRGQLTALHNDIRVLLRSQAGAFIFEHYQNTLLPAATGILLDEIDKVSSDLSASLVAAWTHFYCHALPTLEAVFIHVKVRCPSPHTLPAGSAVIPVAFDFLFTYPQMQLLFHFVPLKLLVYNASYTN